jgi:hypothetical protein
VQLAQQVQQDLKVLKAFRAHLAQLVQQAPLLAQQVRKDQQE